MNLDAGTPPGPAPREVEQRLNDELPGWFTALTLPTVLTCCRCSAR